MEKAERQFMIKAREGENTPDGRQEVRPRHPENTAKGIGRGRKTTA